MWPLCSEMYSTESTCMHAIRCINAQWIWLQTNCKGYSNGVVVLCMYRIGYHHVCCWLYIGNLPIQVLFVTRIYLFFFYGENRTRYSEVYNIRMRCSILILVLDIRMPSRSITSTRSWSLVLDIRMPSASITSMPCTSITSTWSWSLVLDIRMPCASITSTRSWSLVLDIRMPCASITSARSSSWSLISACLANQSLALDPDPGPWCFFLFLFGGKRVKYVLSNTKKKRLF
jgi:hypothetical protein